jgi:hypothetical protein
LQVALGLIVGAAAHNISLAMGFAIIGLVYALAFVSSTWPINVPAGGCYQCIGVDHDQRKFFTSMMLDSANSFCT